MKKRVHQIIGYLLSLSLCLTLFPAASAAGADDALYAALHLYSVGLFQGGGTSADGSPNFALEAPLDRAQGVTLLVRLLGAEDEAKAWTWGTSFSDVPAWAEGYVGVAFDRGLTKGVSDTVFGSASPMTADQFCTLLLRSLGYDDSAGDFTWNTAAAFAKSIGLSDRDFSGTFTRGDAAVLSYRTLFQPVKDMADTTPATRLMQDGDMSAAPLDSILPAQFPSELLAKAAAMPVAQGAKLPEWRGLSLANKGWPWGGAEAGVSPMYVEQDVADLADAGFNFIRVSLHTQNFLPDMNDLTKVNYVQFYDVDRLLAWAMERGIHICLDVHNTPGSYDQEPDAKTLFQNTEQQALLVEFWRVMAQRYKTVPAGALSFNIINEPDPPDEAAYATLMRRCIDAIRASRDDRLIFVDVLWTLQPLESLVDTGAAQSFHYYSPHNFTHAGILGFPDIPSTVWPTSASTWQSYEEPIEDVCARFATFSEQYGIPVMNQEFGVSAKIPQAEAEKYLADLIDVCVKYNIPWCGWDYYGDFGILAGDKESIRPGAVYEPYRGLQRNISMLKFYQGYLK